MSSIAQEIIGGCFGVQLLRILCFRDPFSLRCLIGASITFFHPLQVAIACVIVTVHNIILLLSCFYELFWYSRVHETMDERKLFRNIRIANSTTILTNFICLVMCCITSKNWNVTFQSIVEATISCTTSGNCTDQQNIINPWTAISALNKLQPSCLELINASSSSVEGIVRATKASFDRQNMLAECMLNEYNIEFVGHISNNAVNCGICVLQTLVHQIFFGAINAHAFTKMDTDNAMNVHREDFDNFGGWSKAMDELRRRFRHKDRRKPETPISTNTHDSITSPILNLNLGALCSQPTLNRRHSTSSIDNNFLISLREPLGKNK